MEEDLIKERDTYQRELSPHSRRLRGDGLGRGAPKAKVEMPSASPRNSNRLEACGPALVTGHRPYHITSQLSITPVHFAC